ncbi:hypothetical protein H8E88_18665 [candidate division KSB1 bacterium]|nr:hypothetical protein [candidate division KSB1 bacterium]
MKKEIFLSTLFIFLFSIGQSNSQNILVWKNVGVSMYISPENGNELTSDYEIRLALMINNRSLVTVDSLPEDLSPYEMIFITLGFAVDCG